MSSPSSYLDSLTAASGCLQIMAIPSKGTNGLVVTRAVKAGMPVFKEQPLGSLQHTANRTLVHACAHCMRPMGTLEGALSRFIRVTLSPQQAAMLPKEVCVDIQREQDAAFPPPPPSFQAPLVDDSSLGTPIPCTFGCEEEYCSEECRATALRRYHGLLCTHAPLGPDPGDVNPAELFRHQALATNEIFLLAGKLIGRVLEAWARNGNNMTLAMHQLAALHSEPWSSLFDIRKRAEEQKKIILGVTSNTPEEEEEEGEDEEEEEGEGEEGEDHHGNGHSHEDVPLKEKVREWVGDSLTILKELIRMRLPLFVGFVHSGVAAAASGGGAATHHPSRDYLTSAEMDALLDPIVYEHLVGAFELNNIEVKVDTPLRSYLRLLHTLPRERQLEAMGTLEPLLHQAAVARSERRRLAKQIAEDYGEEQLELLDEADHSDTSWEEEEDEEEEGESEEEEEVEESEEEKRSGGGGAAAAVAAAAAAEKRAGMHVEAVKKGVDEEEEEEDVEVLEYPSARGGQPVCLPFSRVPVSDGTALFALVSQMNHSCVPNVQVAYFGQSHTATVIALKDLDVGEELCINYTDKTQPEPLRRQDLLHYGFQCECSACVEERKAEAAGAQ